MRRTLLALVPLLCVWPAATTAAAAPPARGTGDACADAPEDGFADSGEDMGALEEAVDCLVWYAVASGTSAGTYSPSRTVTRAEAASFLARVLRASEPRFTEATSYEDAFDDDEGSVHEPSIDLAAKHGVAAGVGEDRFAPTAPVARGQLATLLAGGLRTVGALVPASDTDHFADDEGSVHEPSIDALADLGIATGVGDGRFAPAAPLTRGQAALLLVRALDLLVDSRLLVPPDLRLVVDLERSSLAAGEQLAGSVTSPRGVQSVAADGCGFADEELVDQEPGSDGVQIRVTLPANTPGGCTLTLRVRTDR